MTILSTNYSNALLALFENGSPPISAVEVGPWFSVQQIEEARRKLPQLPFYFHASNALTSSLRIASAIRRIQAYQACSSSPWISPHIDLLPPGYLRTTRRFGFNLPILNPHRLTARFIERVRQLKQHIDSPVILENMPSLSNGRTLF